jgi:hypothetical protein
MDGGQLSAIRGARLFDGERFNDGPVLVLVDHGRITDVDFTGAAPPRGRCVRRPGGCHPHAGLR